MKENNNGYHVNKVIFCCCQIPHIGGNWGNCTINSTEWPANLRPTNEHYLI